MIHLNSENWILMTPDPSTLKLKHFQELSQFLNCNSA
jgi:hypothetical protein